MSRPGTFRSMSSDKSLPSLKAGGLGLDLSGRGASRETMVSGLGLELNPRSIRSATPQFIPLRQSPISATNIPLSSPSILSLSPSTPVASSSPSSSAYPFPYKHHNHNQSTSTVMNRSTSTLTPISSPSVPASPSMSISTAPPEISLSFTPKKKVGFGKSSVTAESIRSERTFTKQYQPIQKDGVTNNPPEGSLSKKRSSSQLLLGIGKGLNRVGSVMRRNTEGNDTTKTSGKKGSTDNRNSSRKGTRRKTTDDWQDGWEKVDAIGENGDVGIGRPFDIGHDLHVSPDLSDLPEEWLESLKAQGMTESDLLLISAARKKQHETSKLPLGTSSKLPQAPFSAMPSRLANTSYQDKTFEMSDVVIIERPSGLLRKFSFEHKLPETPTRSGKVPSANQSDLITNEPNKELIPRRRNKRFSNQIQAFRESTFGLGEEDEGEWGKSILDSAWSKSTSPVSITSSQSIIGKGKMKEEKDDRIPIPPEPTTFTSPSFSSKGESRHTAIRTLSDKPSLESMPRSPPPPARPRKSPSSVNLPQSGQSKPTPPKSHEIRAYQPRRSSESFGVHYNTSMSHSKSSIGSEIITPSNSMEHGLDYRQEDLDHIADDTGDDNEYEEQIRKTMNRLGMSERPPVNQKQLYNQDPHNDLIDDHTGETGNLLERYRSDPHISLPSSAIQSRSVTPDLPIPSIPMDLNLNLNLNNDGNIKITYNQSLYGSSSTSASPCYSNQSSPKLKNREIALRQDNFNHIQQNEKDQWHYLNLQSKEDKVNDDGYRNIRSDHGLNENFMRRLNLDNISSEERSSIALSILSLRTSTSIQSLHENELHSATVKTAYRLSPINELNQNPFTMWQSNDQTTYMLGRNKLNQHDNSPRSDKDINIRKIEENSDSASIDVFSNWGSDENSNGGEGEVEAKDAMDALGEAARRLRSL
ncbi:uncharacterized protein L201_002184 [Kwoniella dendrophila CBS 6074]|uniref:CRIB domain-containing protein n=1 Tax=Kwoniella dendrophila CBS 6074 TaxID=1295534 RepID=A0AAX4JPH5_9TREE